MGQIQKGEIEFLPVAVMIEAALKTARSGQIVFRNNNHEKKLYFKNNVITSVTSNDPSEYLGQYFLADGYVTIEQFNDAYNEEKTTDKAERFVRRLTLLVNEKVFHEAITEKIIDTIFSISCWERGKYEVLDEYPSYIEDIKVEVSINEIHKGVDQREAELHEIDIMFAQIREYPELNIIDIDLDTLPRLQKQLINLIMIGHTVQEAVDSFYYHFYIVIRRMYQLYKRGVLKSGRGDQLEIEEVRSKIRSKGKIDIALAQDDISYDEGSELYQNAAKALYNKEYLKAISYYKILNNLNPQNIIFKECINSASQQYQVYFFSNIFDPYSRIETTNEEFEPENKIEGLVYNYISMSTMTVKNIVQYFNEFYDDIVILNILERMKDSAVVKENFPNTLHEAVAFGNIKEIRRFLSEGADINSRLDDEINPFNGTTPLGIAAKFGNRAIVEYLIGRGANIDKQSSDGRTPLMNAIEWKHEKLARYLIEERANIHAETDSGYSVMTAAVIKGSPSLVYFLIKEGIDVNYRSKNGGTVFLQAIKRKNIEIIKNLICAGANLKNIDGEGSEALHFAEDEEIRELIIGGVELCENLRFAQKEKEQEKRARKESRKLEEKKRFEKQVKKANVRNRIMLLIFIVLLPVLSISLFAYFSGNIYNISETAKDAAERLAPYYCSKLKKCGRIPPEIAAKCRDSAVATFSMVYRDSVTCDAVGVEKCADCFKDLTCSEFAKIDYKTFLTICPQCSAVCY